MPGFVYPWPGDNFFLLRKILMGIAGSFCVLQFADQPNGQHGIQVDATDDIRFFEKQVKKQPKIIDGVKTKAFAE